MTVDVLTMLEIAAMDDVTVCDKEILRNGVEEIKALRAALSDANKRAESAEAT